MLRIFGGEELRASEMVGERGRAKPAPAAQKGRCA